MTLDSGLFCVFQAPGSPSPDGVTGLPGVRITLPPGASGRPEAISISTFRQDGWLNGTAALVRVATDRRRSWSPSTSRRARARNPRRACRCCG